MNKSHYVKRVLGLIVIILVVIIGIIFSNPSFRNHFISSSNSASSPIVYLDNQEIWIYQNNISTQFTYTNNDVINYVVDTSKKQIYYTQNTSFNTGDHNVYTCSYTKSACNPKVLLKVDYNTIDSLSISPDNTKLLITSSNHSGGSFNPSQANYQVFDLTSSKSQNIFSDSVESKAVPISWLDSDNLDFNFEDNIYIYDYAISLNQLPLDPKTITDNLSKYYLIDKNTILSSQLTLTTKLYYKNNFVYNWGVSTSNVSGYAYFGFIPNYMITKISNDEVIIASNNASVSNFLSELKQYPNYKYDDKSNLTYFVNNDNLFTAICLDKNCQLETVANNKLVSVSKEGTTKSLTIHGHQGNYLVYIYNFSNNLTLYMYYTKSESNPFCLVTSGSGDTCNGPNFSNQ